MLSINLDGCKALNEARYCYWLIYVYMLTVEITEIILIVPSQSIDGIKLFQNFLQKGEVLETNLLTVGNCLRKL